MTRHTDGKGRVLWLCERHGDDLAAGFAVKPNATRQVEAVPIAQEDAENFAYWLNAWDED